MLWGKKQSSARLIFLLFGDDPKFLGLHLWQYYREPGTSRKFRSKKEVMHYLETGTLLKRKNIDDAGGSVSWTYSLFLAFIFACFQKHAVFINSLFDFCSPWMSLLPQSERNLSQRWKFLWRTSTLMISRRRWNGCWLISMKGHGDP